MMVCFQHSGWRRRSLIDDAKFDTVANAEYEKVERVRSSTSNEGEGHDLEQEHDEEEDVFAVPNGNAPASPTSRKQFHLLLSLREMAALGRIFKLFEVLKTTVLHAVFGHNYKSRVAHAHTYIHPYMSPQSLRGSFTQFLHFTS